MEINVAVIAIVIFITIVLIVFLIRANKKDKQHLEKFLSDKDLDENKK